MALSVLERAKKKFVQKKYNEVISLLEPCVLDYHESFSFHLYLGLACLHEGVIAGALAYLDRAKQIKIAHPDPDLLCAQAAIALRRRDTNKAVECYLDALEVDPKHLLAKKGLDFIKNNNTPEAIGDFIQSGEIKKLYPQPGVREHHRKLIFSCVGTGILCALGISLGVVFFHSNSSGIRGQRADLSALALVADEESAPLSGEGDFLYTLTNKEVIASYKAAQKYFQSFKDNLAQVEVNRILYSNASPAIKRKAKTLTEYFTVPGFDTIKDSFPYSEVNTNKELYLDCWVVWKGMATNIKQSEQTLSFNLLVGYDTRTELEGVVPIVCNFSLPVDADKPIQVLGKVQLRNGILYLRGKSIFQSQQPAQ
ncbi:tetratricopeptide repeat protein [Treponema phagedenis]|uniref:Tetratricopeptide repeat protein n=1 Tax=Treponema phagedenis TaxID=162 RepID=A0AAE6M907_TREPH|nr:hypothetical protein [Treponema phagedenis]NVP23338.1 hypothetical protein [Treponema phagedenis]QEJ98447.1 hypothetical protein FUT82_10865 [Treponema phagedenis]QEK01407.1 hypothetical protein FUT84_09765 [Treponema phagedenis]QEK03954.1 hypothetical protein FUT83_09170 [Treponema phagedenis]QEK06426.1 hypothetical protein FUT80_06695 [Treponema phagedenis]